MTRENDDEEDLDMSESSSPEDSESNPQDTVS